MTYWAAVARLDAETNLPAQECNDMVKLKRSRAPCHQDSCTAVSIVIAPQAHTDEPVPFIQIDRIFVALLDLQNSLYALVTPGWNCKYNAGSI